MRLLAANRSSSYVVATQSALRMPALTKGVVWVQKPARASGCKDTSKQWICKERLKFVLGTSRGGTSTPPGHLGPVSRSQKSQLGPTLREIWSRERDRGGCRSVARPHRCRPAALRQVHPQRTLRPLDSRPVQAADCTNYGQRRNRPKPAAPAGPHLRRAPAPQRPAARRRPRAAASGTSKKERRASEETHRE